MALANKYRPQSFSQVVGQSAAVNALRNIIKNQNFHNGYIFSGTRGVGKTTLGRLFAKALNCSNYNFENGEPCGVCSNCEAIQNNSHLDLIEIDAASRGLVDDVREILENVQYRPTSGLFKVYLIDEVHMFGPSAFNALLKTLEEPPKHVIFILATTEPHKIPKTILSRCLQFNLKLVSNDLLSKNLEQIFEKEKISSNKKSTDLLVELAKGSVRDSLTYADQAITHCDGDLKESEISQLYGLLDLSSTEKLFDLLAANEIEGVLKELARLKDLDVNYEILFERLLRIIQNKIIEKALQEKKETFDLHLMYQFFNQALIDSKFTESTKDAFEIATLRCLSFLDQDKIGDVKKKPEVLEKTEPLANKLTNLEVAKKEKIRVSEETQSDETSSTQTTNEPLVKVTDELNPNNWLEIFDKLDLKGASRAFFANMQLLSARKDKLIFVGQEAFTSGINKTNIEELQESLIQLGYQKFDIEINVDEKIKNTPSNAWTKKRDKEILNFQDEILKSKLVKKISETTGQQIKKEQLEVIDHEK